MACFAIELIRGDTILGLSIKSNTISNYLTAAAKLYTDRQLPNPFTSKVATNYPKILIKALKEYEKVPDRREVITDTMFEYINEQASMSDDNSLTAALKDWFAWGRYSGPRRSEWCQMSQKTYERAIDDTAIAITPADIVFYNSEGKVSDQTKDFNATQYAIVEWRWQKNDENGEKIKYYVNTNCSTWCPVHALRRIKQRAKRLGIPDHEPIGQYVNEKGKRCFITDAKANALLQEAARKKLGITDKKILSKWTTHSLRVTAANELHRLGFSMLFIKHRLRWKSEAFVKYLRHTIHVARRHTEMMSLNDENLILQPSNLEVVNARTKQLKELNQIYRTPGHDDILWKSNFIAAAQA